MFFFLQKFTLKKIEKKNTSVAWNSFLKEISAHWQHWRGGGGGAK
jgi:hypothetical protein